MAPRSVSDAVRHGAGRPAWESPPPPPHCGVSHLNSLPNHATAHSATTHFHTPLTRYSHYLFGAPAPLICMK
ncbi:hypothetical protein EYF80_034232 [Liparis tanakae]|uniref:Uncharacterized protein n=1 Tax=Liparis tanakae TaxID=230148 RepID=A0A4Z2GSI2_9TELE|nr:hypothetical protein EYF80_034232 [Liparis tanakae]